MVRNFIDLNSASDIQQSLKLSNPTSNQRFGFEYHLKRVKRVRKYYILDAYWLHGWLYNIPFLKNITRYTVEGSNKVSKFIVYNELIKKEFKKYTDKKIIVLPLPFVFFARGFFNHGTNFQYNETKNKNLIVFTKTVSDKKEILEELKKRDIYLSFIKDHENDFDKITICISGNDGEFELWKSLIKKYNFNFIKGVNPNDINGYFRLLSILKDYTFVTSNALGSYILYASLLKKKVSISGPMFSSIRNFKLETLQSFSLSKNKILNDFNEMESKEFLQKNYNFLIKDKPIDGKNYFDWSNEICQFNQKINLDEICEVLDLNFFSQLNIISKKIFNKLKYD